MALAVYARASVTPAGRSAQRHDRGHDRAQVAVPSVLETPEWVTTTNMNSTVIADKFVPPAQLCASPYATAAACKAAGITP